MKNYEGTTIYITGGSSGIGFAFACELAALGANVLIFARDRSRLAGALAGIEHCRKSASQRSGAIPLDVSDADATRAVMASAVQDFGAPDILINSAGIGYADYFENISDAAFDRVMRINLYGVRNVIGALLPALKETRGSIVVVSSYSSLMGLFGYTAYATSKFALNGFLECLRPEVRRYGIRISVVCPPVVETPLVEEERKTIPREAINLKKLPGELSAEQVARYAIRHMARHRYLIIPGFKARALYLLHRILPTALTNAIVDRAVRKA